MALPARDRQASASLPGFGAPFCGGHLADPAHDAAGAVLGGRPYLFGGGDLTELAAVQALQHRGTAVVAGQLPGPRSDISSVTLGSTAYLVGGYDGTSWVGTVLATSNGKSFTRVANLPVPVRYAAVAGAGNRIWVFGGLTPAGPSRVIQRVNVATGKAAALRSSVGQPLAVVHVLAGGMRKRSFGSAPISP